MSTNEQSYSCEKRLEARTLEINLKLSSWIKLISIEILCNSFTLFSTCEINFVDKLTSAFIRFINFSRRVTRFKVENDNPWAFSFISSNYSQLLQSSNEYSDCCDEKKFARILTERAREWNVFLWTKRCRFAGSSPSIHSFAQRLAAKLDTEKFFIRKKRFSFGIRYKRKFFVSRHICYQNINFRFVYREFPWHKK